MQTAQLLKQYKESRTLHSDGTQVNRVNNFVLDVFTGEGWENHSRYRRLKNGTWVLVRGQELPADVKQRVLH